MENMEESTRRKSTLEDLQDLFKSLKGLSFSELQRADQRKQVLPIMKKVLADFRVQINAYMRRGLTQAPGCKEFVPVVIGSERGFCGSYNRILLDRARKQQYFSSTPVIVGHKFLSVTEQNEVFFDFIPGAGAADEIDTVVIGIIDSLYRRTKKMQHMIPVVKIIYVEEIFGSAQVVEENLLSDLVDDNYVEDNGSDTYLGQDELVSGFLETYLLVKLTECVTSAYLSECRLRLIQVDGACRRLDKKLLELDQQIRRKRQEWITQEIENILLVELTN